MSSKRLLLLQASDDVPGCEVSLVHNVVAPFGIDIDQVDVQDELDLMQIPPGPYDYVYACGHADKSSFGGSGRSTDRELAIQWPLFSEGICVTLAPGALIFLACCRGGLNQIAFDIFLGCDDAESVVGAMGSSITSHDLRLGFHALVHNLEYRQEDPRVAVDRASAATGRPFELYERDFVEVDANFVMYRDNGGYCRKYPDLCVPDMAQVS